MDLENELLKHFGFNTFLKGQKEVIQRVVNRESTAAIFPTGAGKSMCYQLPALLLDGVTIVVSPLISLMHDQLEFLHKHNIKAAALDSTLTREQYQQVLEESINGNLKILMISVERFKNERFRSYLNKMHISLLVVDEAHCISEWGHNFRPEYLKLPAYISEFKIPQVLLLTATATQVVSEDICKKLNIKINNCIRTGFYRSNLFLKVTSVKQSEKKGLLLERINTSVGKPTIVYVTLQKSSEEIAEYLTLNGINSKAYHAGLKSEEREVIQNDFMQGQTNIIVATIAFGMGIDKSDIRQIIHYDLPKSIENYSQEIGRAGRDGKPAYCEVFGNLDGLTTLENFIYGDTPDIEGISMVLQDILDSEINWEIKTLSLSNLTNIRQLPLKTLLVYLEMKGIITSLYSYFAEYQFKTEKTGHEILEQFNNERKEYLKSLFKYTQKKRTWITVDIDSFVKNSSTQRTRAISALEYLDSQNLIELSSKQSIEVYRVNNRNFDTKELSLELLKLFQDKESSEIKRVHNMVELFKSKNCLSVELASYFGDKLDKLSCGHCSVCSGDKNIIFEQSISEPLDINKVRLNSIEILKASNNKISDINLAKFLCGIPMPIFNKLKVRSLYGYSSLENYPFQLVKNMITNN